MLYELVNFSDRIGALNVFRYITFRTGGAIFTALLFVMMFGPAIIDLLRVKQGKGQPIREDGPQTHLLKRGTPLKVARIAVLFSDLTGSTALYSKVGDAAAFRLVDDHFDVLRTAIEEAQGTVVKTMGDAVMASFPDARQCARGALLALERFEAFRAAEAHGAHIGLKLGMFAGPCYVVTANGALDYFGQTVNVASRVQHLAGSGELVITRADLDALPQEDRARLVPLEDFEARVKGVDEPLKLVRARLLEKTLPAPPASMKRVSEDVTKLA